MKKHVKTLWAKYKTLTIIGIIILIAISTFLLVKTFLYVKFLLGNDIILKVEADKEDLFLVRGEEGLVKFKASVTTNPFCSAKCDYSFRDISRDIHIDKDSSTLRPGKSLERSYDLKVLRLGSGQDLYRFEMQCQSVNTWLCHTEEDVTTRSILISVNYDLSGTEKKQKEEVKSEMEDIKSRLEMVMGEKVWLDKALVSLNKNLNLETLEQESDNLDLKYSKSKENLLAFKDLFKQDKYGVIHGSLNRLSEDLDIMEQDAENFRTEIDATLVSYNGLIDDIDYVRKSLEGLKSVMPDDEEFVTSLNRAVTEFNEAVVILNEKNSLEVKKEALLRISETLDNLSVSLQNLTSLPLSNATIETVSEAYFSKIELDETYSPVSSGIVLEESSPQCCVFRECEPCCVEKECNNNPNTYPVMLLHGHAVSEGISADYSLEGFTKIQKKLEEDGYLNAGTITLYTQQAASQGLWGLSGKPVVVRSSYYFDVFQEAPENYVVVQTKSESIDTYALRLKELIDIVKYRTGKPKVNIVAFSMGGLVTRKYLQIFGSEDVSKIILIGAPNYGVVGEVANVCPLLGAKLECRDLTEGSLFLNKLNRGTKPDIAIHTIVGTGCEMDNGKLGDGVVLEDHSIIPWADNHVINGICTGKLKPLHLDLLKPELYPEAYATIVRVLKEEKA
ncbi:alpha/beta hydrolase [Candidatus Woesearchaeota archaeon]|nr:alpha/beta hydrolase [Candidatus Woesearchaeota archaeon]